MENYRVIFHIDDFSKWNTAFNNVKNLIKDQADNGGGLVIEVLANGSAVRHLAKNAKQKIDEDQLIQLIEQEVRVVACNNALTANRITREALFDQIEVVSAGVSELVAKQNDGFAYIKV